ncbi:MAG: metalloprotease PmbA [Candidatus Competibacteraceae bacterium]|nr:metalloprotease PmbA [Candidatus Competibacteraceae bacterium]MBK8898097.1 metalloprotease PmbA [Candidatus Competibacteraceae bacterium]MBK8961903.1 metalloprotease PmbA [Candidatus Competibacteraceae bacterium]
MSEAIARTAAPLPAREHLETLVADILAEARAQGATAAEAAVSFGGALSVTVRLGEVETLEHHRQRGLGVTVYIGQSRGSASTADWRPAAIRDTVQSACAIARHTAADPYAGLADPKRLAREAPELDLYHPWALSAEDAIVLARDCEGAALAHDARIRNSEGASVTTHAGLVIYGNSDGFYGGYPTTRHSLSCSVIAQDDSGMQRDNWYTLARDRASLEAPSAVGQRAARRALRQLGSRQLATRQAPVLFAPELARGLIGHFTAAIRGGALYRKASFLLGRLGTAVFPAFVTLREQPHLPKGLASAPFDNEGVATADRDLVSDGVLQGYVLDSYSARRLGMETTGNAGGIHNLIVEPGPLDHHALLRQMGTGLWVTHLLGHGANLVTGDYSRGAAGFWVENGEIAYPVQQITIAGNLVDIFQHIVAIGNDVDARSGIRCGSLLVERMTVAGE